MSPSQSHLKSRAKVAHSRDIINLYFLYYFRLLIYDVVGFFQTLITCLIQKNHDLNKYFE
jgi:hypothetical protein